MITRHFYSVNEAQYRNKFDALSASSRSGHQVLWHWHDEWNAIDWQQDPTWSLRDIYRERAQQLRDTYDYLVLSFSGGSDSWTVLNSFISNHIHIDEVFFRWPFSATANQYTPNRHDRSPVNHLSEWDLTVKPTLDQLARLHPEIRITLHDCSYDIVHTRHNDNLLASSGDHLGPGWWAKFDSMGATERLMIDQGKTTAFILGVDKPQIYVNDNRVYCYFLDILVNSNTTRTDNGRTHELFYWSPETPAVTYTQARMIYRHLQQHPEHAALIDWSQPYMPENKRRWDQITRSIIYPDYNFTNFQSHKDTTQISVKTESWLQGVVDDRYRQGWQSLVTNTLASLDLKFVAMQDQQPCGFQGFISEPYFLGFLTPVDQ